jgi:two-component system response regulator CpxR
MTPTPSPLLLIDDDRSLAALITEFCSPLEFAVTSATSGEEGVRLARQSYFTLIILDVMLPGIDGFEALKRIRDLSSIPILMLTTRGAAKDRIYGLERGADDYLPKPFQPEELLARIRSILRRLHPRQANGSITSGDIGLNESERSVTVGGRPVDLTGAEFHLLKLLISQPGVPFAREELVPRIFAREPGAFDRSIDNLVSNLRKKLGPHSSGAERIKGIRNVGYTYVVSTSATEET